MPSAAVAEVCDKLRPGWDGAPITALQETLSLMATLPSVVLILATLVVLKFRHAWAALGVVVLWTGWVSLISMYDPDGAQELARREGCVGSPTLFIALVAAICVAMIIYTSPRPARD